MVLMNCVDWVTMVAVGCGFQESKLTTPMHLSIADTITTYTVDHTQTVPITKCGWVMMVAVECGTTSLYLLNQLS